MARSTVRLKWILLAFSAVLSACTGNSNSISWPFPSTPVEKGSCDESLLKTVKPVKTEGSRKLLFNSSDLKFAQADAQISAATLNLQLKGSVRAESISLSVNGLTANSSDGTPLIKSGSGSSGSQTTFIVDLKKATLSGTPFDMFMFKVIANQGVMSVLVMGSNIHILSAELNLSGFIPHTCSPTPTPTPSPTPAPTPPKVSINSVTPAQDVVNVNSIQFVFSADQTGVSFKCSLDGAQAAPCTSPQTYSDLGNGSHTFAVFGTNASGQPDRDPASESPQAQHSWSIDMIPPTVHISPQATLTNSTQISLNFDNSKAGVTTCSLDGGPLKECISPVQFSGLSEGSHVVAIVATDSLGNISTPATFAWTIDVTAPVTIISTVSPAQATTNSGSIAIQFGANESARFQCAVDNNPSVECQSPLSLDQLTEGNHIVQISATDLAGNSGAFANYAWTVDQTAPVVKFGNVVPLPGFTSATSLQAEFSAGEPATFKCQFDGGEALTCNSPYAINFGSEGSHILTVSAQDNAGNLSTPVSLEWAVDLTGPTLNFAQILPSISAYIATTEMQFDIASSENVILQAALDGQAIVVSGSHIALTQLSEGPHTLIVYGTDPVGNAATPLRHDFTVDLTAPSIQVTADVDSGVTSQTSNQISFTASEEAVFKCQLDGAGFATCQSPVMMTGLADGAHEFQIQAFDVAGNASTLTQMSWSVDTQAPTTQVSQTSLARDSVRFTFSANEEIKNYLCSVDGATSIVCVSPLTLSGLSSGSHTLKVQAVDLSGNIDPIGALAKFTVQPPLSTTLISVSPQGALLSQNSVAIAFSANQALATFICQVDGNSQDCSSPLQLTNLSEGSHTVVIRAVDSFKAVEAQGITVRFTVDTQAPHLTITPLDLKNPSPVRSASFTLSVSEENVQLICQVDGALQPTCTSPVSLTSLGDGEHSLSVQAIDGAGNRGPVTSYQWRIDATPPTTTLDVSQIARDSFTLKMGSSESGSTFKCSLDGGASVECLQNKSYSGLSVGTHRIQVQAVDALGNIDPAGALANVTVQAPISTSITGANPSSSPITQSSIAISFSASQSGATFLCSLDGGPLMECPSTKTYTNLASGAHQFVVRAVDEWGVVDSVGAAYDFTVNVCTASAPVISGVVVSAITKTSVLVSWQTDIPASTQAVATHQSTGSRVSSALDSTLSTSHTVTITDLSANTLYSAQALSGSCGGQSTSGGVLFRTSR